MNYEKFFNVNTFIKTSNELRALCGPTFYCSYVYLVDLPLNFDVLLTVHLSIFILVINQLDAQNFCSTLSLFRACTCFERHVLIIKRLKLYYTA